MKNNMKNNMKLIMENWRRFLNENEESKTIVQKALENSDKEYLEKSLKQRNPGEGSAGSTFSSAQTIESLKKADWEPLSHNKEAISSPAVAYEAPIPGKLGAAPIDDVSSSDKAVIQPAHGGKGIDRKTGKLMAELVAVLPKAPETDFTTIILGPNSKEDETLTVWTFHPGAPIKPSDPILMEDMKKKFNTEEDYIETTIEEAKKIGFNFVKHVDNLPSKKND